jgi:GT2 family glycosyltransferase
VTPAASSETVPVSAVIPTIGRPELLRRAIESIVECDPRPGEIAVVDQSDSEEVAAVVEEFASFGARRIDDPRRGVPRARNVGLLEARHEVQLWTDDDCTVATDWVANGWTHLRRNNGALLTGPVLPAGGAVGTPSVKNDSLPADYQDVLSCSLLFSGNMGVYRTAVLELGGFDERLPMAEDNDLCYRWLASGRRLLYRPDVIVWHHDWRGPQELAALYRRYAHAQGMFCAKHLRAGDYRVMRFVASDVWQYGRSLAVAAVRRRPAWSDWRRGIPRGMPKGLAEGWREFRPQKP